MISTSLKPLYNALQDDLDHSAKFCVFIGPEVFKIVNNCILYFPLLKIRYNSSIGCSYVGVKKLEI